MSVPADIAERHARQLARYAEIAMRAAEKLDVAIAAADEPETLTALVGSLHKAGRALRTSIALEAKLQRDAAADARAASEAERASCGQAVEARKARVRHAVERRIWTELEPSDAEIWTADFVERLEDEALADSFLEEALEEQVARLAADLGLGGVREREYVPRAMRPPPRQVRGFGPLREEAFERADLDDDDEAPRRAPVPRPSPPAVSPDPPPDGQPPEGRPPDGKPPDGRPARLAPPMDLPSWETD